MYVRRRFLLQVTPHGVLAGFQHAFVRSASATPFVMRLGLGEYSEIFTHNEVWLLRCQPFFSSNRSSLMLFVSMVSQVSMETLMTLTEEDFIDLGIDCLGLCQRNALVTIICS